MARTNAGKVDGEVVIATKWGPFFRTAVNKLPFLRRMVVRRKLEKSRPLIKTLEDIAGSYNCTVSEVALSWTVNFHGDSVVAIPGASKTEHVSQNIGAMNLKLSKQEMAKLDELSRPLST